MRVRTNPTAIFEDPNCDDVDMSLADDGSDEIIHLEQGSSVIWIPISDATAFADALKAYASELTAANPHHDTKRQPPCCALRSKQEGLMRKFNWNAFWAGASIGALLAWIFVWLVPLPTIGLLYVMGFLS